MRILPRLPLIDHRLDFNDVLFAIETEQLLAIVAITDRDGDGVPNAEDDLPWALNIPVDWNHPLEWTPISDAYPRFVPRAESGGDTGADWYLYETTATRPGCSSARELDGRTERSTALSGIMKREARQGRERHDYFFCGSLSPPSRSSGPRI